MTVVFALVGGVASGKSTVARAFAQLGATVIDADAEGHAVLKDPQVKQEIRAAFGDVFNGDEIDRSKLAAAAFLDARTTAQLNAITHPRIRARTQARLDQALREDVPAVVLDVSLLLESKAYEGKYDVLLFVDCPQPERERRAAARGWQPGELARRQALQLALETKRALADVIIDNGGSIAETTAQVQTLWAQYTAA